MRRIVMHATRVLPLLLACLALLAVRVVWSSRAELREAQARGAAGDFAGWIDHAGRAARLYAPGNPFSSRALAELFRACSDEDRGRPRAPLSTLAACREVRSSILATRSFYTPSRDLLLAANERIARLSAALESPSVDPGADEAARARWHAERLAEDEAPSVGWTLLALAGFAVFIGCAVGFFFRGVDEQDRLRGRVALAWALGVAAGFAGFLIGLARA